MRLCSSFGVVVALYDDFCVLELLIVHVWRYSHAMASTEYAKQQKRFFGDGAADLLISLRIASTGSIGGSIGLDAVQVFFS